LHEVEVGTASLERFLTVLNDDQWTRLQRAAARAHRDFEGRVICPRLAEQLTATEISH
jgi:hypothetical protein